MLIQNGFEELRFFFFFFFFFVRSNLSNDKIIPAYRPGLKTGIWILEVWSERGCGKIHFLV